MDIGVAMNTMKKIEEYFKSTSCFSVKSGIENIIKELDLGFIEIISIDRVELASFYEIKNFGHLHYCNFPSSFFCVTNLSINTRDVYKVKFAKNFMHPIVFHIVLLDYTEKENEEENLILFAFTENKIEVLYDDRKKSISLKEIQNAFE